MRRYKHQLSHYRLATFDMGKLVPVGCVEVLPGDTFQHSTSLMIRLSPMAAPVMHPVTVRCHHFFVPNRITWKFIGLSGDWEDFITGGKDNDDAQQIPTLAHSGFVDNLVTYLGFPPVAGAAYNALPLAACNLIYNEWYRDQDLQDERPWNDSSVPFISWEKDYYTAARPWAQKGPEITLPLGNQAPVSHAGGTPLFEIDGENNALVSQAGQNDAAWSSGVQNTNEQARWADVGGLFADLSQATAVNVNDVRAAFAFQRLAEARARYGSRYTEYLRYLGVRSSDARLQRPEFLGGGRQRFAMSEVLQTAPEGTEPAREYGVGDLYGHGVAAMRSNRYRRFFEEHGYVISFVSVRPKSIYVDGAPRHWFKQTRDEFYQPELSRIGQQEVYRGEVFVPEPAGARVADTEAPIEPAARETFGFTDRYHEYRYQPSQVSGEFREELNYWHLARKFDQAPGLNEAFIRCDPSKRIFNEQTRNSCWAMIQHSLVARRMVVPPGQNRIL